MELFYPNLSVLDVCFNSLVTLPCEISELSQLAELKVAHNRLKEVDNQTYLEVYLQNCNINQT